MSCLGHHFVILDEKFAGDGNHDEDEASGHQPSRFRQAENGKDDHVGNKKGRSEDEIRPIYLIGDEKSEDSEDSEKRATPPNNEKRPRHLLHELIQAEDPHKEQNRYHPATRLSKIIARHRETIEKVPESP